MFSSVSKFETFVSTFVNVAVEPAFYSKILNKNENEDDVLKFAASFVAYLCEGLKPETYGQTLGTDLTIQLVAKLCLKLKTADLLSKLAPIAINLMKLRENTGAEIDKILFLTNDICGIELALALASSFDRFETLTKLVYSGGEKYYDRLYSHINAGQYQLEEALRVVYRCDRQRIKQAVQRQGALQTFSKEYAGFQMFDIFERPRYLDSLGAFLAARNPKLYTIFCVRNNRCNEEVCKTMVQETQTAKFQDTHQSLACLGRFVPFTTGMNELQMSVDQGAGA